jgi:hypothetical protein
MVDNVYLRQIAQNDEVFSANISEEPGQVSTMPFWKQDDEFIKIFITCSFNYARKHFPKKSK